MAHPTPPVVRREADVDVEATMRDGTVLRADLYRPAGAGPWPVLLARTPYGKQDPGVLARLDPWAATRRGYLVVVQDCRGRFRSDGRWAPLAHESADGHDTVRWASRLPGADGRVVLYGPSYLGHTQWAAIATQPPELCAAAPELTWWDPYDGLLARGGAVELGLVTHWTLTLGYDVLERRYADRPTERRWARTELDAAVEDLVTRTYWELPAERPPSLRRLGLPLPAPAPAPGSPHGLRMPPVLVVAGWFDCFLQGGLDSYTAARRAGTPAALIVGPWSHTDQSGGVDGPDFLLSRELDWFDRHLGQDGGQDPPEPPVLVYVLGADHWRRLETWPPESVQVPWHLHQDGRLSRDAPERDSPPDLFRHDPENPVPTHGGALLMAPGLPPGPLDQAGVEQREDVLVYTGEPLTEPLEVMGRISVHLVADSSAATTDWVARLCDVDPQGVSRNITDGILRARDVDRHVDHGVGVGADRAREHAIDLWSTAYVFRPGHRVRLQIASSCFPRWDRTLEASEQRVFHDAARPSRLVLPVVPRRPPAGSP
ncbi:putative acyl esterase [Streptacidiphilus sp. MAP12-33]|uniref:CocE/NonD family hydrolase n=1 Tax=Streptacidiphilus sp. MAP12-33 TaxID=3156266 RepID=UPI0035197CF1